ncbi:MAG: hypothetical protein KF832_19045 [Caldilineaceae bacterium]|nr:hypothetical protein [Caldilineaceae bacterium]
MNLHLLAQPRRWVLVLATAFVLAATAASAPIWLDNLTGATLTPAAFACYPQGGGCG